MRRLRFLDTNIILRHLTPSEPDKAEKALELMRSIESGAEPVATSYLVIFEVIHTLRSFYKVSMEEIRDAVLPITQYHGLRIPDKHLYPRAFDLCLSHNISFADGFNAAYMEFHGLVEIYSWDQGLDRVDFIQRVEPGDAT